MLIGTDFVFLHLQKTGGNHVAKLLKPYVSFEARGKHNGLSAGLRRPHVFMGIRNPWDWYVSLWAYGCQSEGTLWSYLTSSRATCAAKIAGLHIARPHDWHLAARHLSRLPGKDSALWRRAYADSDDPTAFRAWLRAILSEPTSEQTGEDYSVLPLRHFCGLMTARYLQICSEAQHWRRHRSELAKSGDVFEFLRRYERPTSYVRTEHLEEDVAAALSALGHEVVAEDLRIARTNSSRHRTADFYYDREHAALVADRDRLICEAHGYSFPGSSASS